MYLSPATPRRAPSRSTYFRRPGPISLIPNRLPRGCTIAVVAEERLGGPGFPPTGATSNPISTRNLASGTPLKSYFNCDLTPTPFGCGLVRRSSSDPMLGVAEAPTNACSLECLFMPTVANNSNALLHFDGSFPATSTHDRDLFIDTGTPKFMIFTGSSPTVSAGITVLPYNLYHLVGVTDGTNIFIYVNGVLKATAAGGTAYAGNTHFIMGDGNRPTGGAGSNGAVMFLGVYSTVAWNAREVADRYRDPYSFVRFNHDWTTDMFMQPATVTPTGAAQTAVSLGMGT